MIKQCFYLPGVLGVDGDDAEAVAAEFTGPAAALADPLQEAGLVGVAHRAVAAARVQQGALQQVRGQILTRDDGERISLIVNLCVFFP